MNFGTTENGWTKSMVTEAPAQGAIKYAHSQLTHSTSTSSDVYTGFLPSDVIEHFHNGGKLYVDVTWGSGTKNTVVSLTGFTAGGTSGDSLSLMGSAARASSNRLSSVNPKSLIDVGNADDADTAGVSEGRATVTSGNNDSLWYKIKDVAIGSGGGAGENTVDIAIYIIPSGIESGGITLGGVGADPS